jgi:hypothetical protein
VPIVSTCQKVQSMECAHIMNKVSSIDFSAGRGRNKMADHCLILRMCLACMQPKVQGMGFAQN